jgi:dihydropteroate synthase
MAGHNPSWAIRDRVLSTEHHTLIMAVVNVTPDSFSDGGHFAAAENAIAHGIDLWEQGADIIDVGGESTRPGAEQVPVDEEISRVVPVVAGLVAHGAVVSIDTTKPVVAEAAVAAGAHIVNDVTALDDPDMVAFCANSDVGVVLMHMQGEPRTMQDAPSYENVVSEVATFLEDRAVAVEKGGVSRSRVCVDPGIGFGKNFEHNLELLENIGWLVSTGYPVLVGASRKRFLGTILKNAGFETVPAERDPATAATVALAVAGRASVVRVHNVGHAVQAARTADAIVRASQRR